VTGERHGGVDDGAAGLMLVHDAAHRLRAGVGRLERDRERRDAQQDGADARARTCVTKYGSAERILAGAHSSIYSNVTTRAASRRLAASSAV
jgi:hypothetical protein